MESRAFEERVTAAFAAAAALARETVVASAGSFLVRAATPDAAFARNYLRAMLPPRAARDTLDLLVLSGKHLDLRHLAPQPAAQGRMHEGTRHWLLWESGVLQVYDHHERRGLVWLANGAAPSWELSRPAAALLNQAAQEGPCTLVHGAAIGRDGHTLLLVAPGRSGKTSAALACTAAGWDYAGDDYVMVDSASVEVLPLYASARLREDMVARFPALLRDGRRAISEDGGETRHELDLARVLDPAQLRGGRVAAILVPRRRGARQVEFSRAGPTDAFHAMFAATMQGAPGGLAGHARKLAALVARAPVYFVDTGPDPAAIPEAFAALLSSLEVSATVFPG